MRHNGTSISVINIFIDKVKKLREVTGAGFKDCNLAIKESSGDLDKVEMEDEEIVQSVQKGVNSAFYNTGRFSPTKEKGVHHFHSLISRFFNEK